jgi:hypothetical protein
MAGVGVDDVDSGVGVGVGVVEDGVGNADELAIAEEDRRATCLLAAVQPTSPSIVASAKIVHQRRPNMLPGCHATPMRMRGAAAGVSHCMIGTRLVCGIATHPAVGVPSVT